MGDTSDTNDALAAIRAALVSGTDVEDRLSVVLPQISDREDPRRLGATFRNLLQAAPGAAEATRRIADGLDRFGDDVARAATVLGDAELAAIGEQARDWGRALWASEMDVDHAFNHLRHALVELCRRRASIVTGRPLGSLR